MKAATKMANRYNARNAKKIKKRRFCNCKKIDCTSTDMPRLPCLVVGVCGKAQETYVLSKVNLFVPPNEVGKVYKCSYFKYIRNFTDVNME